MGEISKTAASLRFMGDEFDPDEITSILGTQPTIARRKGCLWFSPNGTQMNAHCDMWSLSVPYREPGDLDGQIAELMKQVSDDLLAWKKLAQFKPQIFCGVFLNEWNEGIGLSAKTIMDLGARGIELDLDIYSYFTPPDEPSS